MRTLHRTVSLAGLLLLIAANAGADDRPWIEVRSPRFTVVSQAGEKSARDLAWQFEQVHAVFLRAYPWAKLESGRPFIVLAVRNAQAMRELSPKFWEHRKTPPAAAFVSDAGQDFVAIRSDASGSDEVGENPYSTAYQGYVSIVLNASFPGQLPFWFRRGLQSFFGNTLVRQKDVHVGRLIKGHMLVLQRGSPYPIPELMAIERTSPSFQNEADRQVFDAQAWLLVHYLAFGEKGTLLPKLNRFAALLSDGRKAAEAFGEAFGDVKKLEEGLGLYLTRRLFGYSILDLDVNIDRASFRVRPVSTAEAMAWRAAFLSAMQEPGTGARALAESALQADPIQPVAYEALGLIADDEKRADDARAAYARAVEHGSRSFYAHYRLAQLLWKPESDQATLTRIVAALEKAAQLNPDHSWSYSFLADTRVDLGEAPAALEPARKAVQLAPGESYHRRALARVLGNTGDLDAAIREAGRALALGSSEDEKRAARELLGWLSQKKLAAAQPAAPAGVTAAGDTSSPGEGRVILLDKHPCESGDAKLCRSWLDGADKACADGSLEACSSAGWAYSAGPAGVEKDRDKAERMLEKACAGGHQLGCVNLAVGLAGRQTPAALKRALEILSKSCAAGTTEACRLRDSLQATQR